MTPFIWGICWTWRRRHFDFTPPLKNRLHLVRAEVMRQMKFTRQFVWRASA